MSADFFNKYPYTDFHELNIDWLLGEFKTLQDSYQGIIDWIENDASNYEDLVNRMDNFVLDLQYLQRRINTTDANIVQLSNITDQKLAAQYERITLEYQGLYSNIMIEVNSRLTAMELLISQYNNTLTEAINSGDQAVMNWVTAQLDTFLQNLPDYEHLIIYNPVRGIQTTVQVAIDDLYNYFNMYALTAQEYDDLGLTAATYDSYEITAHKFDTEGRLILGTNSYYLMRSPFTGQMAPIQEVVMDLYSLHRTNALTADAYDLLDMTASYYDGLLLEALNYDLNGI